jgi:hypothetical protein
MSIHKILEHNALFSESMSDIEFEQYVEQHLILISQYNVFGIIKTEDI